MGRKRNEFFLDADFRCQKCASIIGVRVPLASVKATGHEVTCGQKGCGARYLVTEEGATPVDKRHLSGTVHSGYLAWDQEKTHTPEDFEPGASHPAVEVRGAEG